MSDDDRRAVWRVRAQDDVRRVQGFDALVLVDGAAGAGRVQRHVGLPVPYEGEMPDRPLTLIVAARPGVGALVVEYRACRADGTGCVTGRSMDAVVVIARSATGILVTGLRGSPRSSARAGT